MMSLSDLKLARHNKTDKPKVKLNNSKTPNNKLKRPIFIVICLVLALVLIISGFFIWNYAGPGAYKQIPNNLVGKTYNQAFDELSQLGISSEKIEDFSDKFEVGKVMLVTPAENTTIKFRDETVILTISKGIKYINFPNNLKDIKTADLLDKLTKLGFTNVVVENDYSTSVAKDFLIKSSVREGTKLRWDSKIVLANSKGPKPVVFPSVIGRSQAEAVGILKALAVKIKVVSQYSETVKKDLVISQNPIEETKGFEGDEITLIVSLGPPITTVPNVVGLSLSEAHNKLKKANLKWQDQGSAILNLVQKQSVAAGKSVAMETVIVLTVV
ncbi:MAG: PASTA domain-containing protein, partial [Bifidobacteriaceae bacterium]|jgi:serine/threonine-protein kinase|nr:PASTA domain-containing protein [Bifidobacteriaceae bacterium]